MFNKDGIPFFIIIVPFLCILFISFFSISYYLKLSNETYQKEIILYKELEIKDFDLLIKTKSNDKQQEEKKFIEFVLTSAVVLLFFMALFTYLMFSIIKNIIKKYKYKVQNREEELKTLNESLSIKIEKGIEEAKQKDKKILEQAKLARIGSMISMIAHQWRQPLSQLSGILMELETITRFKKVNDEYILNAINKSDKMIEFMSNTIDDFRNFYKPDKIKEEFLVSDSCLKAINIIDATLENLGINLIFNVEDDRKIFGYPTEFSQVILNIISNAKDILMEKEIKNPKIQIDIKSKGI